MDLMYSASLFLLSMATARSAAWRPLARASSASRSSSALIATFQ